jgi:pimeloyl-ACP methyl ester carboxylesterase
MSSPKRQSASRRGFLGAMAATTAAVGAFALSAREADAAARPAAATGGPRGLTARAASQRAGQAAHAAHTRGLASRLYWEYKGGFFNTKGVSIPVAVSVFPSEQYQAPRSWTERAYPKLIYFHEVDRGGHFAAWEQPLLFSEEVRAGFSPVR